MIIDFLSTAKRVMVLEDNEPYVENKIKAIAHDANLNVKVLGKTTGHVPGEGELDRDWMLGSMDGHTASGIERSVSS